MKAKIACAAAACTILAGGIAATVALNSDNEPVNEVVEVAEATPEPTAEPTPEPTPEPAGSGYYILERLGYNRVDDFIDGMIFRTIPIPLGEDVTTALDRVVMDVMGVTFDNPTATCYLGKIGKCENGYTVSVAVAR